MQSLLACAPRTRDREKLPLLTPTAPTGEEPGYEATTRVLGSKFRMKSAAKFLDLLSLALLSNFSFKQATSYSVIYFKLEGSCAVFLDPRPQLNFNFVWECESAHGGHD